MTAGEAGACLPSGRAAAVMHGGSMCPQQSSSRGLARTHTVTAAHVCVLARCQIAGRQLMPPSIGCVRCLPEMIKLCLPVLVRSFVDPTNAVTGLSKYVTALGLLFDPAYSKVS
jgi:hypothetical protein